jgi:hypothetical protein
MTSLTHTRENGRRSKGAGMWARRVSPLLIAGMLALSWGSMTPSAVQPSASPVRLMMDTTTDTPQPLLDYYYSWDLGQAGGARQPSSVLWWLTNRADYEFPFGIHQLSVPYTVHAPGSISDVGDVTATLNQGSIYAITANAASNPIRVDLASMQGDVAVLTFTALPGHSEGTDSTIRFSSWIDSNGELWFDVTGHDTFNYDGVPNSWLFDGTAGFVVHGADKAWYIKHVWDQLASNIKG